MKTRIYILSLAAMALLAGCTKEIQDNQPGLSPEAKTFLNVGIGDVKTYMGDSESGFRKVYWSNGDMISVNGNASDELVNIEEGATSAKFSFSGTLTPPYKIMYPAGIYSEATVLPAIQEYKADGFADNMFPMAGYSADGSDITLNHLCAIVKVSVLRGQAPGSDEDDLVSVRFKGRNDEQVSGIFRIDFQNATLSGESSAEEDKVVKVVKTLSTSTDNPAEYYIVVPAGTYPNGFDVIVQDRNGHIMTKSKTASKTLEAGHLYKMPAFEFIPTATEIGIEIASAQDLVDFATAYNAKEYDGLGSSLVATVTADLTFDAATSASFAATKGIGNVISTDDTNYFNGVLNGNNHTISGYTGDAPLFAYTGGGGRIKDLIIAADCDKTIASDNAGDLFGAFVAYHKGVLENCVCHADLTFSNITVKQHFYGGLVGRNHGGKIIGCTMDGDIICPATGVSIATAATQAGIGGIAGRSNGETSKIEDCHFNGNITVSDGSTYGGITGVKGVNFDVGGIVGHLQEGQVNGCDTGTGTMDVRGTFNAYMGGIAGWTEQTKPSKITGCTNNMAVALTSNGGRSVITPTVVAGIVGHGTGVTVSKCINNGALSSLCNANLLYMGGIAAMGDDSSFDGCQNTASLTHTNQVTSGDAARYLNFGGIVGIFSNASTNASTVNACKNSGKILCNQLGTSGNTTVDMGGIVGKTDGPVVTITNCKNFKDGTIKVIDTVNKVAFARTAIGGIIGYSNIAGTSISGCENSAHIWCQYTQGGTNNRPTYLGGIAGFLGIAAKTGCTGLENLEIDNCHNSGCIQNQNYNNTVTLEGGPVLGGIAGAVLGTDSSKASIHDCTSASPSPTDSLIMGLRGISGSIVGYASNVELKDDSSTSYLSGNNNATGAGGIAGWIIKSSITDCSFSGLIGASSGSNVAPKNVGGLVYLMDGNSTINGCKVDDASISKGTNAAATAAAVLVSSAESGATITNCGVKGTLDSAPITLASNMITTDGGATVTGTYLIP